MSLGANGVLQLNTLKGSSSSIIFADLNGNLSPLPFGTASQVLYGNGVWGALPAPPAVFWNSIFVAGGSDRMLTGIYYTGGPVGINTSTLSALYALDVNGDARVRNLYADQSVVIGNVNATRDVVAGRVKTDTI